MWQSLLNPPPWPRVALLVGLEMTHQTTAERNSSVLHIVHSRQLVVQTLILFLAYPQQNYPHPLVEFDPQPKLEHFELAMFFLKLVEHPAPALENTRADILSF